MSAARWSEWGWHWGSWHWQEDQWGWQRSRHRDVGVYFGTFDPIHENHLGLASFACDRGLVDRVYFVVNGDNPLKPLAVPFEDRQSMVQRRLALDSSGRLRLFPLTRHEAERMRWQDRESIAQRVRREAEKDMANVRVHQLVGQDSFEQAVLRSGKGKGGKGIFSTRTHFLVFPRAAHAPSVQVPGQMARRVRVVEDYADPQPLSSTAIRALTEPSSLRGKVHPELLQEVFQVYTRPRRFLLLILGPPGSGKTSLGRELSQMGFYHLSGGDVFRIAESRGSTSYDVAGRKQTVAKVFGALVRATALLGSAPVSFDGFLPKDLPDFEEKVGRPGLIIKLTCPEEVLLSRMERRGQRENDVSISKEKRIRSSFAQHPRLHEYETSGLCRELDSNRPLNEVVTELFELVKKASETHRLLLDPALSSADARGRVLDEDFWHKIFQEIESKPSESYNLRSNPRSMQERQGSRALKNVNNLVKDVLITWAVRQVATSRLEVLDVASGRGGDQLKFLRAAKGLGRTLAYNAVDVAGAQVSEARQRLRQRLPDATLECARFFVGDVVEVAPSLQGKELPWQHVVSIQFALHYAFASEASARSFLGHATRRLCTGGLLLITTLDATELSLRATGRSYATSRVRIDFGEHLERIRAQERAFGLCYHFDLTGEGIDCKEFVVPEELLRALLEELGLEMLASVGFKDLPLGSSDAIVSFLAAQLGELRGDFSVYDRLGLELSRDEVDVLQLYKLYVARRRAADNLPNLSQVYPESTSEAGDLLHDSPPVQL